MLLAFFSCSTGYHIPESVEEKMARYQSHHQNINLVPEFKILPFKRLSNRRPASVEKNQDFARGYSNKRLYFLALYTQYNQFVSYSESKAPRIKLCPGFNTAVQKDVEQFPSFKHSKRPISNIIASKETGYTEQQIATYPELSLPVVKNDIHPTVADISTKNHHERKKLLKKALDIHIAKIYSELGELCETGSSDNYYTFENLHAHLKSGRNFKADPKSLEILYKTTIFTNQSLIHSLSRNKAGRSIASVAPRKVYINELISRLEVRWFQNYLHNIGKK